MAQSQEALSEAASTLAASRHSWVPTILSPSVSEAARALAQKRNALRKSRTSARASSHTSVHARAKSHHSKTSKKK